MIPGFDKARYELYDDAVVDFLITIGSRTMSGTGKVLDVQGEGVSTLFFIDGIDKLTNTKVWLYVQEKHITDIKSLGVLAQMILDLEARGSSVNQSDLKAEMIEDLKVIKSDNERVRDINDSIILLCIQLMSKYGS